MRNEMFKRVAIIMSIVVYKLVRCHEIYSFPPSMPIPNASLPKRRADASHRLPRSNLTLVHVQVGPLIYVLVSTCTRILFVNLLKLLVRCFRAILLRLLCRQKRNDDNEQLLVRFAVLEHIS